MMLPLTMSFVLAVCSSSPAQPASLPAKPSMVCAADDLACWKMYALVLDKALDTTRDLVVLERTKVIELERANVVLTKGYESATKAAEKFAEQAIKAQSRPWHENPMFAASVASVATAALAIGLAYGLRPAASP
jgi:hypothetical protein